MALHNKFQSTLPRRERPDEERTVIRVSPISIHAPTKGATDSGVNYKPEYAISIHAPTKGATDWESYEDTVT